MTLRTLLCIDSNLDDKYLGMSCQAATAYSKIELTEHLQIFTILLFATPALLSTHRINKRLAAFPKYSLFGHSIKII